MVTIELKRTGGLLGKTLTASGRTDMDETALIKKLKAIAPVENPHERDGFYTSIVINGKKSYPIDITLLQGSLKNIVSRLEQDLKVE